MGKFVYILKRDQKTWNFHRKICQRILQVPESVPHEISSPGEYLWVSNINGVQHDSYSLATGVLNFEKPLEELDHFSFRILNSSETVSVESDSTGSRTVWYYLDADQFILASSQRVISSILQSFEPNPKTVSWMLCTGSLGFGNAWDIRISSILPNTQLILDKQSMSISVNEKNLPEIHEELGNLHDEIFSSFNPDDTWGITLSGGVDSRAALYHLVRHKIPVQSFTWGTTQSLQDHASDAAVAREVASQFNIPFTFMALDSRPVDSSMLGVFLANGEGRTDHINTFIDGLANWKALTKQKIRGIVRADEAFGWIKSETEKDVRISLDLNFPEDYENLNKLFDAAPHLEKPVWPVAFNRGKGETIEDWRDRLYRSYRLPYILAALQDPMLNYFEVTNPFLHPKFVGWAKALKGSDRSNKRKFNQYSTPLLSTVAFSKRPSVPEPEGILLFPAIKEEILRVLQSALALELFGERLIKLLVDEVKSESVPASVKGKGLISRLIPFRIKKLLRRTLIPYRLNPGRILLRAYIVVAMRQILTEDIKYAKAITD